MKESVITCISIILAILLLVLAISLLKETPNTQEQKVSQYHQIELSKFKGMKRGVDNRDWNQAADEMVDSRWYEQVTNRANRLVDRMRNIEHS